MLDFLARLKGWRTILFNTVMGLIAVLRVFGSDIDVTAEQVDAALASVESTANLVIALVTVIGNALIRMFTDTPVGQSEPARGA